jgi:hypothetical protein
VTHKGRVAIGLVLAVGFFVAEAWTAAAPELRLGTAGPRFTIDGSPRFLTLVSYFDAMDAVALDQDLATLARSVDGVRIFANWWDLADPRCRYRFSDRTLFERRADGVIAVRRERLERLKHVLARARDHGLVVDLTFAADPVAGASKLTANPDGGVCPPGEFTNVVDWTGIAAALHETARALATPENAHVFFDLQNEAGHNYNRASEEDLRRLVVAVRSVDRARLISVSMFNPDADRQAGLVKRLGLSMLNFHDVPRGKGWGGRTAKHVSRFRAALDRAGLNVPIYVGEPDPGAYDGELREFERGLTGARTAGAGAWTFHTRVAYDLETASLDQRLDPLTRRVLVALRGWQAPPSVQ